MEDNFDNLYAIHQERWKCECANKIYVYRIHSNGTKHWGTQCLKCGRFAPLKRDDVPFMERGRCGQFDPQKKLDYERQKDLDYKNTVQDVKEVQWDERQKAREAYYQTDEWKKKSAYRLRLNQKIFNGLCEICFQKPATQCHHVTYKRLYKEWIFDLAAVCCDCHVEDHEDSPFWSGHSNS